MMQPDRPHVIFYIIVLMVWVGLVSGIGYVMWHFVSRYW